MSPYGGAGAQALIDSVSEVGASYFASSAVNRGLPWLAVVPLADAVTLPACSWPQNVVFIDAFHGGLLGKVSVQRMVERFLAAGSPGQDSLSQPRPAPNGRGHLGRGHRLADAGTPLGLPVLNPWGFPRPVAAGGAIRYAMARDANAWPSVVAPPVGGVLTRGFAIQSDLAATAQGPGGRFVFPVVARARNLRGTVDSQRTELLTRGGVRVTRTATPFDPAELGRIAALVDERRGGVMSSGMEYPGRYSRWHMAYADPCAEIIAVGRRVTARALNDRGRVLLPVIRAALRRAGAEDVPHEDAGRDLRRHRRDRPGVHRGGAQPQADRVHRAAGNGGGIRVRRPASRALRGVRL